MVPASQNTAQRGPHSLSVRRQVVNHLHVLDSPKAGRRIMLESALEAAAALLFEGDSDIVQITEQPLRIPVARAGSSYTTLDIGTRDSQGNEKFYEIKHTSHLVENSVGELAPPNWDKIQAWATQHGWDIGFLTNKELEKEKYTIHNWRCLLPYVWFNSQNPNSALSSEIYQTLTQSDGLTIQELSELTTKSSNDSIPYVVADLLHRGKVTANLKKSAFSTNTPITRGVDNNDRY